MASYLWELFVYGLYYQYSGDFWLIFACILLPDVLSIENCIFVCVCFWFVFALFDFGIEVEHFQP